MSAPITPNTPGWSGTWVGEEWLPDLPWGWDVAVDTEGSGLFVDGDPFSVSNRPASPEARISAVSVTFRWPNEDGTPGEIRDFAWPFDQGPVLGKPGSPVKDPITGVVTFRPINQADQDRLLAVSSKVLGFTVTVEYACPNLSADEYGKLILWLDERDSLTFHNSVHDMHQFRVGLREGAGGDLDVPEGLWAWDVDSEPGTYAKSLESGTRQKLHMMEPTAEPLTTAPGRRTIWCTMVTQKQLIDPLYPAALKPTAKRLWGEDETAEADDLQIELGKQGTGMTKRYDLLPWCGAVGRYAAKDTNLCYRLKEYQVERAENGDVLPNFWPLYEAEMNLRTTLYRMERRAVAYNKEASLAEADRLRAVNAEAAKAMPFDPSKIAQAKRFFFGPICTRSTVVRDDVWEGDEYYEFCAKGCPECEGKNGLGLEPTHRTEKKQEPQLNIDELLKLSGEGRPWAAEYLLWTKRRNAISKWYIGWGYRVGRDGRIRTSHKQCKNDRERAGAAEGGTVSGRLAVGRWQSQAIPHKKLIPEGAEPIRPMIGVTEPGTKLVRWDGEEYVTPVRRIQYEHDLSAGEIRVVTVIANSTRLWDALDAGQDTHAMNTKALFGVDETHPDWEHLRNAGKRGTFGILYGGGVNAVHEQMESASGLRFSKQSVADAKVRFFETYPEFKLLTRQAEQRVTRWMGGCGYLKMLDGWRRWYAESEKTNSAVNQIIQGNLARAMIYWMNEVEREVPGCLLLQIHDSLVTEHDDTPEGAAEAQLVSDIGQRVFQEYFNVRGRVMDFGISPDRWDKKT